MTILHLSDLHFNRRWFNWLRHNAPTHDLLVLAGDLLNHADATPLSDQIKWVSDWIRDYPKPISVCSGPHDLEWNHSVARWTPADWLREFTNFKVTVDDQRGSFGRL